MRDINTVQKAVAVMANQLHKLGYSYPRHSRQHGNVLRIG